MSEQRTQKRIFTVALILTFLGALSFTPLMLHYAMPILPEKPQQTVTINLMYWTNSYSMPYDQGFEMVTIEENSTGSWVLIDDVYWDESGEYECPVGCAIRLEVWTWLNSTHVGAGDNPEGQRLQQHNVSVTQDNGTVVFSQQNFTYNSRDAGIDPPLWLYEYHVTLNFLTDYGEYYTIDLVYETFW